MQFQLNKPPVTLLHVTVPWQTVQNLGPKAKLFLPEAPKLIEHLLHTEALGLGDSLDWSCFWFAN